MKSFPSCYPQRYCSPINNQSPKNEKLVNKPPTNRQKTNQTLIMLSDPQSELLDRQSPESELKFTADLQSTIFSNSKTPQSVHSFRPKSVDPGTHRPPQQWNNFYTMPITVSNNMHKLLQQCIMLKDFKNKTLGTLGLHMASVLKQPRISFWHVKSVQQNFLRFFL